MDRGSEKRFPQGGGGMSGRSEITKHHWIEAVARFKGTSARAGVQRLAILLWAKFNSGVGLAWPTLETLASELQTSEERTSQYVSVLKGCGSLQVVRFADLPDEIRKITGSRKGRGQAYRLNLDWAKDVLKSENERVEEAKARKQAYSNPPQLEGVSSDDYGSKPHQNYGVKEEPENGLNPPERGEVKASKPPHIPEANTLEETPTLEIQSSDSGGAHISAKKEALEEGESDGNVVTLPSPKESEMSDHKISESLRECINPDMLAGLVADKKSQLWLEVRDLLFPKAKSEIEAARFMGWIDDNLPRGWRLDWKDIISLCEHMTRGKLRRCHLRGNLVYIEALMESAA